jgi:hypothetical protein
METAYVRKVEELAARSTGSPRQISRKKVRLLDEPHSPGDLAKVPLLLLARRGGGINQFVSGAVR